MMPGSGSRLGERVDELLRVAAERRAIPGAVVTIVSRDGLVHESAAGGAPDGARTMFRIASMTKALTSVAALQLFERGELDLDADVASVLPAFAKLRVLDGFDGDRPRLREPARQATIRQLLTHTAGHGYWFSNADLLRYHAATGIPTSIDGRFACLDAPLVADPGTRWEYGINTDWLGRVVEEVSGETLDRYLAAKVFAPLRMNDATFAPSDEQRARLFPLHTRRSDGAFGPSSFELPRRPEFWPGGHGAFATSGDYARFLRALLRGGELDGARILRPETVDLMFSDQLGGIPLPAFMQSAVPELTNDVPSPPFRQTWGLGLHVMAEDVPGMRRAGTGDWAGLFNSFFWVDRTSDVAVAFFTQVLPFFDGGVLETLLEVEAAVYSDAS